MRPPEGPRTAPDSGHAPACGRSRRLCGHGCPATRRRRRTSASGAGEPRRVGVLRPLPPARAVRRRHGAGAGAGRRAVRARRRPAHGRDRRRLGGARRHVAAVLRRQAVRGGARARGRARRRTSSTSQMLTDVFAECVRKLEPGGRIAVNVANLGRKPYRSLSADVIRILEHDLGLLLRGELIWQKGEGASGSCAWGSFRSAANPVLRDITERVIVASKGRFDRARSVEAARRRGPARTRARCMTDDFMALTLDVWSIPPESARRVGHPAPFPVELPEQLIRLYTFARRPRARPVHGQRLGARRRGPARPPLRRLRPRPGVRRDRPAAASPRRSPSRRRRRPTDRERDEAGRGRPRRRRLHGRRARREGAGHGRRRRPDRGRPARRALVRRACRAPTAPPRGHAADRVVWRTLGRAAALAGRARRRWCC